MSTWLIVARSPSTTLPGSIVELELGLLRQRRVEQRAQLAHELADVDGLAPPEVALARVGEHLPRERRRALRRRDDGLRRRRRVGIAHALTQELGVAEDAGEQVVEVVRDAAREHAEAVEPLRALHLLLERAPLGLEPPRGPQVAHARDAHGLAVERRLRDDRPRSGRARRSRASP